MIGAIRRTLRRRRAGPPIVVVSGLPRSGTSMLMKMLEAGGVPILTDGARRADVDNPKGYYEYERIKDLEKESDKSYLREARGRAVKVISFLLKDLPDENDYCVVFMRRDLDEILTSQDKMIERLGSEDAAAGREAMKEGYRNEIVRSRLLCRKRPNFEWIEVHYRESVESPAATAARLNQFLGGGLDEAAMVRVVDESLYRNRQQGRRPRSEP